MEQRGAVRLQGEGVRRLELQRPSQGGLGEQPRVHGLIEQDLDVVPLRDVRVYVRLDLPHEGIVEAAGAARLAGPVPPPAEG